MFKIANQTVNLPSWAKSIARESLDVASNNQSIALNQLIVCKVFTAFMVEGVIAYIGSRLDSDWYTFNNSQRSKDRSSLVEKHKAIRKLIGLSIGDEEYNLYHQLCDELSTFRDTFAHPKQVQMPTEVRRLDQEPTSGLFEWSSLSWEKDLDVENTKICFNKSEVYCRRLLDVAVAHLRDNPTKYPHIIHTGDILTGLSTVLDMLKRGESTTFRSPPETLENKPLVFEE